MERPGDCVAKSFFGVCLTGSAAAFSSLDPGETNLGLRPAVWRADCSRLESQGLQGPALSGHRGRKPQRRTAGCAVCPDKSSFRLLAAAPAGDQPVACHRAARGPKRGVCGQLLQRAEQWAEEVGAQELEAVCLNPAAKAACWNMALELQNPKTGRCL